MARTVQAKKRCCQDRPRCKRCPVVLKRLARVGLAEPTGGRTYRLARDLKPRHLRKARLD